MAASLMSISVFFFYSGCTSHYFVYTCSLTKHLLVARYFIHVFLTDTFYGWETQVCLACSWDYVIMPNKIHDLAQQKVDMTVMAKLQ